MKKAIRHLLPKSHLWNFTKARDLVRLLEGLGDGFDLAREESDRALLENFAEYVEDPKKELEKYGIARKFTNYLTEENARNLLIEVKKRSHDLGKERLETILQSAGLLAWVHQWWDDTPATAYEITNASFVRSYDASSDIDAVWDFTFGRDPFDPSPRSMGKRCYMIGRDAITFAPYITEHRLGEPFDLSSVDFWVAYNLSTNIDAGISNPKALTIHPQGEKIYFADWVLDVVYAVDLGNPWQLSSANSMDWTVSPSIAAQASNCQAMAWHPDGLRLFLANSTGLVYEYTTPVAWEVTSLSYAGNSVDIGVPIGGMWFSPDGLSVFFACPGIAEARKYSLPVAWNITSGLTLKETLNVSTFTSSPQGIALGGHGGRSVGFENGSRLFVSSSVGSTLAQFSVSDFNTRDPLNYITQPLAGRTRCGKTSSRCGVFAARCDSLLSNDPRYIVNETLTGRPPRAYNGTAQHVFYVGGQTFPNKMFLSDDERALLELLVLRYKRAGSWAVLLVPTPEEVPPGEPLLSEGGEVMETEGGDEILLE